MSSAKLERQKRKAQRKGLLWSNDAELRKVAGQAAIMAVIGEGALEWDELGSLVEDLFTSGFNPSQLIPTLLKSFPSREERNAAFAEAWNAVIQGGEEPSQARETAKRRQVDFGTVGSKLPPQAREMMQPSTDPEAWRAWVVPAIGLVAAFILWRRS